MKPFIDQAFWSDPEIEAADARTKLTSLWLITNSQTSLLGLCSASVSRFMFETGLTAEALDAAIQALPRAFKKFGGTVFVRNYIRHQFGSGDKLKKNNFFTALKSLFLSVKDAELKAFILAEYPEFEQALTKGFEGLSKPKDGKVRKGKEGKATREDLIAYCVELGLPASDGEWLFDKWQGNGWKNDGKPIASWTSTVSTWKRMGSIFPSHKNGSSAPKSLPTADEAYGRG